MTISTRALGALLAVALLAVGPAAAEDNCHPLTLFTSVPLSHREGDKRMFVPVTMQGKDKFMLLDTGGAVSEITPQVVDELGLNRRMLSFISVDVAGETSNQAATVAPFVIGTLTTQSMEFVVAPEKNLFGDSGTQYAGILGPNVLMQYDVDIDFGAPKLSLLSPDHCDGKVIYWPAAAVAVVPMRVLKSGHIIIPVELDGKTVSATLDTGADTSTLALPVAESDFGLKLGSADTPYAGDMYGKPGAALYHHKFSSLSFGGIAVSNLDVTILPDFLKDKYKPGPEIGTRLADPVSNSEFSDMLLGMNVLRHLHVYIAYKERKLYITPASPSQPTAVANGAGAPAAAPAVSH